ncbi:DUF3768 domain-containing protein [Magnetospirillum gryphiswaldense]|uniref:DUF3768 domain-containing protein n=1 Tax=Magnetospirillum gryphiswaldense TaxID=55518 RepID=A4U2T1_9PROT|nr:DUF3768 domain-containing protein [Magnetospirillum gryphiswaldense]AVM74549.1 hypothetical protein MSR1_20610 [Magnetospirillum gryphiswaldense MSR-1]AVM78452.1 hypothetical protein MSR1L_20610 [Magnetospirillum gryphiswaldense]CAM77188.1 conserved hypothetical protein [Magnetospirillum gryphiswaldense MSR-1]
MDRTERIAALNDQLRRDHRYGKVVITRGIQALGHQAIQEVLAAVAAFAEFTPENDPYAEHDCALMTVGGHRVIWKVDCYDTDLNFASDDPADPAVTIRVLTIMLSDEW